MATFINPDGTKREVKDGELPQLEAIDAFVLAERERCAKIAESVGPAWQHCGAQIAAVIRRGK